MDNTGNTFIDTVFKDIAEEKLTPKVVELIVEYEEIQTALLGLNDN